EQQPVEILRLRAVPDDIPSNSHGFRYVQVIIDRLTEFALESLYHFTGYFCSRVGILMSKHPFQHPLQRRLRSLQGVPREIQLAPVVGVEAHVPEGKR